MPSSTNTLNPTGATPTDPYILTNNLGSTDPGLGASLIGVSLNGCFTSTNVQDALEEICAGGGGGGGPTTADQVSITDAGGYYVSDNVEGALQEVGSELQDLNSAFDNLTASEVAITDVGNYYASTDVEGALQEIGAALAADVPAVDVSLADVGNYYISTDVEGALQEVGSDLQSVGNSINSIETALGNLTASDVGVVDAGGYYTSDNVEGVLQEVGLSIQNINAALGDITASEVSIVDAGGYYTSTEVEGALQELGAKQGAPNGIATLNAFGKVPSSQLSIPDPIYFEGTWDALTNTPDISAAPNEGATWIVSVAGNTNLGGITDWNIGDWAIFHDGDWFKIDNTASNPVSSVNGYIGAVVLTKSDLGLGNVENTALSTWSGSTNLTTLGTIVAGVWQGSSIGDSYISGAVTWNAKVPPTRTVNGYALSSDVTLTKNDVGLGNVEDTALSTWPGSTNLITLGTVTTGTWNGSPIGVMYGGTGATNESDARDNLGLTIGSDVQAWSATLDALATGTYTGATSITTLGTISTGSIPASLVTIVDAGGYYVSTDVEGALQEVGAYFGTYTGSTSIITLGTVTTGTWNGTAIGDAYLSSATYWNAKVNPARTITTTAPLYGGGDFSSDRTFYMTQSDATHDGYLSQADWLTFSNKVPQTRTINGYALSANVTLTKSDVGLGNVENTALSTWTGNTFINTVDTITSGTWQGTTIAAGYGGTGIISYTLGDILYGNNSNGLSKLAGNTTTTRQFLRQTGTGLVSAAPVWDTVTKTDVGLSNVENTALSTWAGSANITTLGTIASGTVPAALTSIVDVGNYYTGTNVEAALQEVGLSLSTGAGGVRFNVASGVFQEATLSNYLFDVRYVNTGTGAAPGANISSLAKGNGNNSTGIQVTADVTSSGQTAKGINVTSGSANSGTLVYGVDITASSSGNTGTATGLRSVVSGTSSTNVGISTSVSVNTAATTNTGVSVSVSGVSTNVGGSISVTGAATTNTGLTIAASGATTNYAALFTAGNVGVGTSTPTQLLTVQNGNLLLTNNNNTAAELRLAEPSGSGANYTAFKATTQAADITYTLPAALPATAASGTSFGTAMLEVTSAGVQTWRQQSVSVTANLNFNNTGAQSSSDLTITVTGAAVGDCVNLGVDPAAVLANSCYTAWVSAADTVTVRFNNYSNATQNPAAGTFKVIVTK